MRNLRLCSGWVQGWKWIVLFSWGTDSYSVSNEAKERNNQPWQLLAHRGHFKSKLSIQNLQQQETTVKAKGGRLNF